MTSDAARPIANRSDAYVRRSVCSVRPSGSGEAPARCSFSFARVAARARTRWRMLVAVWRLRAVAVGATGREQAHVDAMSRLGSR
jgi:hypothetical protein